MFRIKMLEERSGSDNGHLVERFYEGHIYTVGYHIGDSLARSFIRNGWATEIAESPLFEAFKSPDIAKQLAAICDFSAVATGNGACQVIKHRQSRAQMSIRFDMHTVTDSITGERFELEPVDAWKKFNEINGVSA